MDSRTKRTLDTFYRKSDPWRRVESDPIKFPRFYKKPGDIEIAGFIASSLAYGKVDLFMPVVERILGIMGSPYDFITGFGKKSHKKFSGIKYRFNETEDIVALLHSLGETVRRYGSLEKAFMKHYDPSHPDIGPALSGLMETLKTTDTSGIYGNGIKPNGFLQFFPSPAAGSACKRGAMYLRWMVRDKDIDLGVWKGIEKSRLVIPLDTHIARVSRCLGLTKRKSNDWKTAVDITASLRAANPEDPLRYDFALCHYGISGDCGATKCGDCMLKCA